MNNLISLIKINFLNSLNIRKLKNMSKIKLALIFIFFIYIAFSIEFSLYTGYKYLYQNSGNLFFILVFIISIISTFIFTIYYAKGVLFDNKDTDLLFSIPIKTESVLLSRIISLYLYNFVITFIITLPSIIISTPSLSIILIYIICLIATPIISTIISGIIGFLLAFILSKTNLKSVFETIYYIGFLLAYFYVYNNITKIISKFTSNMESFLNVIKIAFFPIYLLYKAFIEQNILYSLLYLLLNLFLIAVFTYILKKIYHNVLSNLNSIKTKSDYKVTILKENSINKALLKKEFTRYIKTPVYLLNTLFGIAAFFILSIMTFFYEQSEIMKMLDFDMPVFKLLLMCLFLLIFLSNTTSVSISLEKENLWILKSLPIDEKKIFNIKALFNIIIVSSITTISLILLYISSYVSIKELLYLIVYSLLLALVSSNYGTLINLIVPNLTGSDTQIVKRSISCMICVFTPMIFFGILVSIPFSITKTLLIGILIALFIIYIILKQILKNYGVKKFRRL